MDIALRNTVKKQLLWVALVSISMFFASMLSAFIVEKADVVNWKVFILPDQFEISTVIILVSSFLLFFIKPLLKREKSIFGLV
ncbi:MAG: heme-copper oxidase subunit III, partial [Flavobacteriales bacterium]